jgi:hypothetical protein
MLIHTTSYFVSILVFNALWVAAYLDVAGRWASHCIEQNREAARQWLNTVTLRSPAGQYTSWGELRCEANTFQLLKVFII